MLADGAVQSFNQGFLGIEDASEGEEIAIEEVSKQVAVALNTRPIAEPIEEDDAEIETIEPKNEHSA